MTRIRIVATILVAASIASAQQASIAMEEIRGSMREVKDAIWSEYQDLLRTVPDASGNVTVAFTITSVGAISDVVVTSDPGLETLSGAAEDALRGVSFDAGLVEEPLEISVPFECSPPPGD